MVANKLPKVVGRVSLCHALNETGGVHSEFTITREKDNSFYLVSAGGFQRLDHDWIIKHIPSDGSVTFEDITNSMGVLVIVGPKSRELMKLVSNNDFNNEAFPWLTAQNINIGNCPALAMRVNFVGELGWELHHPIEYQNQIFDLLFEFGNELGIKPFGIRAMDSLRLEKSYRLPGRELSIEYSALESGLGRFVSENKGDFIGRNGLADWKAKGFSYGFVTLEVHDVTDADALGNNPIYYEGKVIGRATSGGYGHRIEKSLVLAMIEPSLIKIGLKVTIDILGKIFNASIIEESPYDPQNNKLRS